MVVKPSQLLIRAYDVGFGDCLLLTFVYGSSTGNRHMLIDFGSTEKPPKAPAEHLKKIADDIRHVTNGEPLTIVATHRHKDHIGGFSTGAKNTGSGSIIRKLKPKLVIQPWTEEPSKPADWEGLRLSLARRRPDAFRLALSNMQAFAAAVQQEAKGAGLARIIRGVAEDGLKNLDAIKNLATMAGKANTFYVHYGSKVPPLKSLFPGVTFKILGPPTIKQKSDISTQSARHETEFWNFASFWRQQALGTPLMTASEPTLSLGKRVPKQRWALEAKWFISRVRALRQEQLLGFVRAMDNALNNTSIILLFAVGKKKFLFPGDAQWENWEYALSKHSAELKDVILYKVGHHGSLNATPKSLWRLFKNAVADSNAPHRLSTVLSTVSDSKHGDEASGTEVPRRTLVAELRKRSVLYTTQDLENTGKIVGPPITFALD